MPPNPATPLGTELKTMPPKRQRLGSPVTQPRSDSPSPLRIAATPHVSAPRTNSTDTLLKSCDDIFRHRWNVECCHYTPPSSNNVLGRGTFGTVVTQHDPNVVAKHPQEIASNPSIPWFRWKLEPKEHLAARTGKGVLGVCENDVSIVESVMHKTVSYCDTLRCVPALERVDITYNGPVIAMEKVEAPWHKVIANNPSGLSTVDLLRYSCMLFDALDDLHSNGFSHGDIKPSNIMMKADRSCVKFVDLGNARMKNSRMLPCPDAMTEAFKAPSIYWDLWHNRSSEWESACCGDVYSCMEVIVCLSNGIQQPTRQMSVRTQIDRELSQLYNNVTQEQFTTKAKVIASRIREIAVRNRVEEHLPLQRFLVCPSINFLPVPPCLPFIRDKATDIVKVSRCNRDLKDLAERVFLAWCGCQTSWDNTPVDIVLEYMVCIRVASIFIRGFQSLNREEILKQIVINGMKPVLEQRYKTHEDVGPVMTPLEALATLTIIEKNVLETTFPYLPTCIHAE
jgi:hypothetical protein